MIGHSLIAIQIAEDNFIASKENCWFGAWLSIERRKNFDEAKDAKEFKSMVISEPKNSDLKLTFAELKEISMATSCIEGHENYHKEACDGIYVIPLDKDIYVSFKEFEESQNK